MNRFHPFRRVMAPILALALAFTLSLPASDVYKRQVPILGCFVSF